MLPLLRGQTEPCEQEQVEARSELGKAEGSVFGESVEWEGLPELGRR